MNRETRFFFGRKALLVAGANAKAELNALANKIKGENFMVLQRLVGLML
jgi:hypothetical protein